MVQMVGKNGVVRVYNADPKVWHLKMAAGFAADILTQGDNIRNHAPQFLPPVLMMHGTADKMVSPDHSFTFFKNAASQDKTYISLPDWYHELLNEPEKDQLMAIIWGWVEQRIKAGDAEKPVTNSHFTASSNHGKLSLNLVGAQ